MDRERIWDDQWGDDGQLRYEVKDDGSILIYEGDVAMGWTDKEGLKKLQTTGSADIKTPTGTYINVSGTKFKIFKASIINDNSNNLAGTVLSVKKGIFIKTIDGAISLDLVLMPGKKIMSGKDFSNGQKLFYEGQHITNENIN